jgi:hypothetical protein
LRKDACASPSVRKHGSAAPSHDAMLLRQTLTALVEIAIALDGAQDVIDRLVDDLDARGLLSDDHAAGAQHRGRHRAA